VRALLCLIGCLLALSGASALAAGTVYGHEIRTEHFLIRPTVHAEATAGVLAQRIEAVRANFQTLLGHDWPGVTEVRVGVGREEMEALCPGGRPPGWAAALAFPEQHLVVLEAREWLSPAGDLTLRHELTHAALAELGGPWPRWFHEGLAMRLSGETLVVSQYAALFRGVTQDRLFHFEDLARGWPDQPADVEIAYAQSASFVGFLVDRHGPARLSELLAYVQKGDPFETAFGKAMHSSLDVEERDWRRSLPSRYSWWPILTGEATIWFLVAVGCVVAWARRKSGRAQWEAEQLALEAVEDEALPWEGEAANDPPQLH
jgi:hypothetical protein